MTEIEKKNSIHNCVVGSLNGRTRTYSWILTFWIKIKEEARQKNKITYDWWLLGWFFLWFLRSHKTNSDCSLSTYIVTLLAFYLCLFLIRFRFPSHFPTFTLDHFIDYVRIIANACFVDTARSMPQHTNHFDNM